MSLDIFRAYVSGYQEQLFEHQLIAVQTGYWVAYFQSKHPKPLNVIIQNMCRDHENATTVQPKKETATDVDVERFLRLDKKFAEYRQKGGT